MLFARLFESLPLVCSNCGADMRISHNGTEAAPVERILAHTGEPPEPPPIAPARGPPGWADPPEPVPEWDLLDQPEPDVEFDPRISWQPRSSTIDGALARYPGSARLRRDISQHMHRN